MSFVTLQGIVSNKVSVPLVTSCSPRGSSPPSPRKHHSPPPKKRRSVTLSSTSPPTPTSSSAEPSGFATPDGAGLEEDDEGSCIRFKKSFALHRSDLIVTPSNRIIPDTASLPPHTSANTGTPPHPPNEDAMPSKTIKLEMDNVKEIKEEEEDEENDEEAVNLVMESGGMSILRQRVREGRSPETPSPLPPPLRGSSHNNKGGHGGLHQEETSLDEGFLGGGASDGGVNDTAADDQDKCSPMVIRSPLIGLLPIDTPGEFRNCTNKYIS